MQQPKLFQPFEIDWKKHAFLSLMLFLIVVLFRNQGLIIQQKMPMLLSLAMLLIFHLICRISLRISIYLENRLKIDYPSFILWLYPTLILSALTFGTYLTITITGHFWGRGFWSRVLQLNGQETTRFFSSCFVTMIIFTSLHFGKAVFSLLLWLSNTSRERVNSLINLNDEFGHQTTLADAIEKLKLKTDYIQTQRKKANKVNRIALLSVFTFLVGTGCWVIFFKPAVVLYYRAELQLKTFIEPMAAYKTLEHLKEKYPGYRYLDTVSYRMAWILDRRLKEYQKAASAYRDFLRQYAPKSSWSDEAYISLVRLLVDKLQQPRPAIDLCEKYLKIYPYGIFEPHIYLYMIRAWKMLKQPEKAKKTAEIAQKLYSGKKLSVFNSEDQIVEEVDFDDALKAEINLSADLQ